MDGPCEALEVDANAIFVPVLGERLEFDSVYPALGSRIRSECAVALGAKASDEGCLVIDDHQRTTIPGLYAAGDVAKGLDQISHAMGEAGVAATTIRNDLAEVTPLIRERSLRQPSQIRSRVPENCRPGQGDMNECLDLGTRLERQSVRIWV